MKISFNNRDPVYIQVVRYFKEQLAIGALEPGQEIPSRRELASMLGINPNTAQKAYKEMEEQGLIRTERNFPSKITSEESIIMSVRTELLKESVDLFIRSVKPIQVPIDELLELVKSAYWRKEDKL